MKRKSSMNPGPILPRYTKQMRLVEGHVISYTRINCCWKLPRRQNRRYCYQSRWKPLVRELSLIWESIESGLDPSLLSGKLSTVTQRGHATFFLTHDKFNLIARSLVSCRHINVYTLLSSLLELNVYSFAPSILTFQDFVSNSRSQFNLLHLAP